MPMSPGPHLFSVCFFNDHIFSPSCELAEQSRMTLLLFLVNRLMSVGAFTQDWSIQPGFSSQNGWFFFSKVMFFFLGGN